MEPDFWHRKWRDDQIGFHRADPNPLLTRHLPALALPAGARVFVPLCGKSRDVFWLHRAGFAVAGAELSAQAVDALFAEAGVTPRMSGAGPLRRADADGVTVFTGDIFELDAATLGKVDAVYDRAALVALPAPMRERYAAHLAALTAGAPQLLVCTEYDQSRVDGPPFSVDAAEVRRLYGAAYAIAPLDRTGDPGGIRGVTPAWEAVWLLRPR